MTTAVSWAGDDESKPAPGALRRIQGLVNTIDRESGQDRLANAGDAGPWLIANGLLAAHQTPSEDELATVRATREALRGLLIHNSDSTEPAASVVAPLRELAADVTAHVTVEPSGAVTMAPVGDSVRARLVGLLLVVQDAQRTGTWAQLKACANEDCQWAFYDRSRNRGGTWCDMAACGNKLKNRDFRARQRGQH